MLKIIFQVLAIVGVIIISILAFTLPSDPYEIIPAMSVMSFDKPLWACYMFGGSFLYLLVLLGIYDIVNKKIA
ncbi:MAG: hypothetical protein E7169_03950 [Firmicutes bacterium]|nr:hypothetical protein [Bacillota bacterium]